VKLVTNKNIFHNIEHTEFMKLKEDEKLLGYYEGFLCPPNDNKQKFKFYISINK
jgi:hypothetical protein